MSTLFPSASALNATVRVRSKKRSCASAEPVIPTSSGLCRNINLDIEAGSFFGLIGHNGSGKSTLLRLMAGIHRPTLGSVEATGRLSALLELGSGFHPDLTGRENVYLNGAMLGITRKQMTASMDDIIEFSGIGDFVDEPVKIYSSGMYVRLGVRGGGERRT